MDLQRLYSALQEAKFDDAMQQSLIEFFNTYQQALAASHYSETDQTELFDHYIHCIQEEVIHLTTFNHFHENERFPFDFFEFGRSIVSPLIDYEHSCIIGQEHLSSIIDATDRGENVILLANHQTEVDPQILSLLITPISDRLGSSMIFIAGHRVTTDPLAIPFSRGVNLLSIFSKKYIDFPPEKKAEKLIHNAKTLAKLEDLLNEGGKCIYVAPSGGRDRFDQLSQVQIAPFDPQSVEMFSLLSQKATQPTHLHLLALSTIKILPPPLTTRVELGESRQVAFAPARLAFGPALDMEAIGSNPDKKQRRIERAAILTATIEQMHNELQQR
jgi:glycerol-3-phosphate O-acyltransferase